jgi:hypothetical protein
MHEMGVSGYGIHLAAYVSELIIFVCQIFKLCRTNEGKVSRIEKENTPFAENIFLRNSFKLPRVKSIGFKIRNLFVNN